MELWLGSTGKVMPGDTFAVHRSTEMVYVDFEGGHR